MTIAYLEAQQDELDLDKINMMIQFIEECDALTQEKGEAGAEAPAAMPGMPPPGPPPAEAPMPGGMPEIPGGPPMDMGVPPETPPQLPI